MVVSTKVVQVLHSLSLMNYSPQLTFVELFGVREGKKEGEFKKCVQETDGLRRARLLPRIVKRSVSLA